MLSHVPMTNLNLELKAAFHGGCLTMSMAEDVHLGLAIVNLL